MNVNEAGKNCCEGEGSVWGRGGRPHRLLGWIIILALAVFAIGAIFDNDDRDKDISSRPSIVVSGQGEVLAKPDVATVTFGVTEESLVVADAQSAAAKKTNDMLAELKKLGVAENDVKTTGYNIYPRYDYARTICTATYCPPPEGTRKLAGYVVSTTFELKIRVLADAGKLISALGGLGATDISGLSFTVDNEEAATAQARDKAVADAKAKAKALASQLGVRLVRIIAYNESGAYPPVRYAMLDAAPMAKGASVPELPAGENKIVSNVTITYEIR